MERFYRRITTYHSRGREVPALLLLKIAAQKNRRMTFDRAECQIFTACFSIMNTMRTSTFFPQFFPSFVRPLPMLLPTLSPFKARAGAGNGNTFINERMELLAPLVMLTPGTAYFFLLPTSGLLKLLKQESSIDEPYRPEKYRKNIHINTSYFLLAFASSLNK